MAVRIRLMRIGRAHSPQYRIVAVDSREARNGKPIEVLGSYSPLVHPPLWAMRWDRVEYWLSQGAQVSDKVQALLRGARKREEVSIQ